VNGTNGRTERVYIAHCGLAACSWSSDPLPSETQAHEAYRKHIDGHAHSDLVDFVANLVTNPIERYERQGDKPGGEPEHGEARLGY